MSLPRSRPRRPRSPVLRAMPGGAVRLMLAVLIFLGLGLSAPALAADSAAVPQAAMPEAEAPEIHGALIYYHSKTCPWCARWEREILPAYPKTPEGRALPVRFVDSAKPRPDDLSHIRGLNFHPTFVVVGLDGQEVGRILGYQPDWFWAELRKLADQLGVPEE